MSVLIQGMELKPCTYRVKGKITVSYTLQGETYYSESFMPCMGENCAVFDSVTCTRNGMRMDMEEDV